MIGIFDSGLGGLSVLREVVKILPDERYVYYADTAHCPYGDKTREYVIGRARHITEFLMSEGASLIVVACNTATAAAISVLRTEYPHVKFVGMEPAVKPAALHTRSGVIGILATAGTLKGGNYLDLREKYSGQVTVTEHVGRGFVELVEKGILEGPEAEKTVGAAVRPLLERGADTIVLGCTHYPFLEKVIRKVCGAGVEIINPAPAVARQVLRLLGPQGAEDAPQVSAQAGAKTACRKQATKKPAMEFFTSGSVVIDSAIAEECGISTDSIWRKEP